ncbi:MAG TPA: hypothetical protein VLV83_08800 [Acidobacteriota bacterium]|nr:hypothetical protein [Acidobacteriota bacterium]
MRTVLSLILILAVLPSPGTSKGQDPPQPPADLKEAVESYWTGLAEGDKARALEHVHPQTLNAFLKRNEPALRDWRVEEYQEIDADRYRVTTAFKSLQPTGGLAPSKIRETWQRTEDGWKVRVLSLQEQRQAAYQALRRSADWPEELEVFPQTLKFRTGSDQPGVVVIRNGLRQEVEITALEADPKLIEVKMPRERTVPARTSARIALYWKGPSPEDDNASDQRDAAEPSDSDQVTLVMTIGDSRRRFSIPYLVDPEDPFLEWIKGQKGPAKPPR